MSDYNLIAEQIKADFQELPYGLVLEYRERMAVRCAEVDIKDEEAVRWYKNALLDGLDGYRNDDLGTLIWLYLNTMDEADDLEWRDAEHFWEHLKTD